MTTTTAPAGLDIVLAYGPRDTEQPCHTCGATIPANPRPDFGYETEDDEQPLCDTCLRRLDPPGHSALQVLRVIAEAAGNAPNPAAADTFLYAISQGVELLTEDLEDTRHDTPTEARP